MSSISDTNLQVYEDYHPSDYDANVIDVNNIDNLKLKLLELQNENAVYIEWIQNNNFEPNQKEKIEVLKFEISEYEKNNHNLKQRIQNSEEKISNIVSKFINCHDMYTKLANDIDSKRNEKNFKDSFDQEYYYSLCRQIEYILTNIQNLQKVNVFHDLFSIYIGNDVGYINNIMVGIVNETPDFSSINSGLGEIVLLLYIIEKLMNYNYKYYKLNPLGSFSTLLDKKNKRILYVHKAGFFNWRQNLNQGLKGILVCMKEIELYLKKSNGAKNNSRIPYFIDLKKNAIGKKELYSIELSSSKNNYIWWNKAFKCVLSNLKMYMILINP